MLYISFSALKYLERAVDLQKEVLDTHDELIHTHQAMSIVLRGLGKKEEADEEMNLAGECAKRLDSWKVPLNMYRLDTHEREKEWLDVSSSPLEEPGNADFEQVLFANSRWPEIDLSID